MAAVVKYFVKATPSDERSIETLQYMGLPTEPQRFAIVEAYTVTDVQEAFTFSEAEEKTWRDRLVKYISGAGLLKGSDSGRRRTHFREVYERMKSNSIVLGAKHEPDTQAIQKVCLRGSKGGSLSRIAVPVSSNYDLWYSKGEHADGERRYKWEVHPLVRIDPRLAPVKVDTNTGPASGLGNKQAARAAHKTMQSVWAYFVHTYSKGT